MIMQIMGIKVVNMDNIVSFSAYRTPKGIMELKVPKLPIQGISKGDLGTNSFKRVPTL